MDINLNNYETYLLSFVDGELDEATTQELMRFLKANPDKEKELNVLQMTRLPEERDLVFPDKHSLYRKEEPAVKKTFVLRRYQWLSAAAAACIGLLIVFYLQPWKASPPPIKPTTAVNTPIPAVQQPEKPIPAATDTGSSVAVSKPAEKRTIPPPVKKNENKNLLSKNNPVGKPAEKQEVKATTQDDNEPALATIPVLARTENDAVQNPSIAVAPISLKAENITANVADKKIVPESPSSKTDEGKKEETSKEKIMNTTTVLAMTKKDIDSTITQKLIDLNQKKEGIINHIAKNGIKIGKLTIAFND